MLSEVIAGRPAADAAAIAGRFREMMNGKAPTDTDAEEMGDLPSLQSVLAFPIRIKCALLSWTALEDALDSLPDNT
jgi:nitrogen fixation NifU-like protein